MRKYDLRDMAGMWDLIMFHHSLEQMPDLFDAIATTGKRLPTTGTVLVRAPIVPSAAFTEYGENYVQLDAPRHLFLHSVSSLTRVAHRAGLVGDAVVYDSNEFQLWEGEQYARDIPLHSPESYVVSKKKSPVTRADIRRYRRWAEELNRRAAGDQVAVYLRRS